MLIYFTGIKIFDKTLKFKVIFIKYYIGFLFNYIKTISEYYFTKVR